MIALRWSVSVTAAAVLLLVASVAYAENLVVNYKQVGDDIHMTLVGSVSPFLTTFEQQGCNRAEMAYFPSMPSAGRRGKKKKKTLVLAV